MPSSDYEHEKNAFREFYNANSVDLNGALGSFLTLLRSLLASAPNVAISGMSGRIKDREECLGKFNRKYRTSLENSKTDYSIRDHITDLIGLRVVCLYEDDVEQVRHIISKELNVLGVTNKIAQVEQTEDSFGYKGLHLDLELDEVRKGMAEYSLYAQYPFELQIRTVVQDSWSIVDHKIKYKKSIPTGLKRRINTLAALFELADREFCAIRDATKAELAETAYDEIEAETVEAEDTALMVVDVEEVRPRRYAPLNAFNLLKIAGHFFPAFEFEPHKIDGFTQEIVKLKPGISRGKFNYYLKEMIGKVKKYQEDFEKRGEGEMNPFTLMRHCLYAGDRATFASMLTDAARSNFDTWMALQES